MRGVAGTLAALRTPLLRQAGVYTIANLLSRVAPFLLLPVLTRYLSPADYGIVAMFLLVAALLEPFVSLGLPGAISVRFFDKSTDLTTFLGTGMAVVLGAAVATTLVLAVALGPLESMTHVPGIWILLIVPLVLCRSLINAFMALLRVRELATLFGVVQILQTLFVVALTIVLVVGVQTGWPGRVGADLIATGGVAIFGLAWLLGRHEIRFAVRRDYARQLLRFGIPLIPHLIGSALIVQTDRFLLTNMLGLTQTGLYTVGYQLVVVIEIAAVSFNSAYAPWLFRRLADAGPNTGRELVRLTYVQFALVASLAVGVAIVMPWIASTILDPRYADASGYVGWLALGLSFSGMYYMVANYIFYGQKTEWLAAVTFATGLVNIPLTYLLIQLNGGVGAAQASAIAYAITFVLTWLVANRVYPLPWLGVFRRAT